MDQMWALLKRIRNFQNPQDAGEVFPRQSVLTAKMHISGRGRFLFFHVPILLTGITDSDEGVHVIKFLPLPPQIGSVIYHLNYLTMNRFCGQYGVPRDILHLPLQ